ncbi:hypothetical protein ACM26B_11665 [Kluyvera sichuanensis]
MLTGYLYRSPLLVVPSEPDNAEMKALREEIKQMKEMVKVVKEGILRAL